MGGHEFTVHWHLLGGVKCLTALGIGEAQGRVSSLRHRIGGIHNGRAGSGGPWRQPCGEGQRTCTKTAGPAPRVLRRFSVGSHRTFSKSPPSSCDTLRPPTRCPPAAPPMSTFTYARRHDSESLPVSCDSHQHMNAAGAAGSLGLTPCCSFSHLASCSISGRAACQGATRAFETAVGEIAHLVDDAVTYEYARGTRLTDIFAVFFI